MPKLHIKPQEALSKLMSYCSKMERSKYDIKLKLNSWSISEKDTEQIMKELYELGFINDDRYLQSYIRGKYYYNKWGKVKISYHLKLKGYNNAEIDNIIDEIISDDDYQNLITEQIKKKNSAIKVDDDYERKSKLIRFAQSRGYETEKALISIDLL